MRDPKNFATFILTHGRPDNVRTLRTLERAGYSGKTYLLIDDDDATAPEYRRRFGDSVLTFSKKEEAKLTDMADTSTDWRTILLARNASQRIAREMGLDYLLQLDDDYTDFGHRYLDGMQLGWTLVKQFDRVCEAMIQWLEDSNALTVAMSQGGDHIGGAAGVFAKKVRRKAMNSFFIRTDRPVRFVGRLNEDVNAYIGDGIRGEVFLTATAIQLNQVPTQAAEGGMTGAYLNEGTYVKSFYTVMVAPSCTRVGTMGDKVQRFHHSIAWENAVPKILSDRYRKPLP